MRKLSKLIAGVATMAAAAALVAGTVTTASAAPKDPPNRVTPAAYDVVGVGSDTTEYVMDAFSVGYNKTVKVHNATNPFFYSYDALPLGKNVPSPAYKITPKAGCATIARPDGSSAGITALGESQTIKYKGGVYPCLDFARSSRARKTTDPGVKPGGDVFVTFAKDAITWAARSAAKGGTDAPKSLNLTQLKAIFTCKDTNWAQVGGKSGAIKVFLPQAGSGTLSTWETDMGITTVGSCVSQAPEENEGTFSGFNSPNAVFIWSIGAYVAQKYHSAACGKAPSKTQNEFGCNLTGFIVPEEINGVNPLSSGKVPTTNPKFPSFYWRTLYNVLRDTVAGGDHLTAKDNHFFGSKSEHGYMCSNATAQTLIRDYGFVTTPLCGSTS